jgi:hypothetical protein
MFDIKTSIHMVRFVPNWDWYEDPGLSHHFDTCFAQVAKEFLFGQEHIHWNIDPLCIGRGYVLSSRRSTVYSSCIFGGYTLFINTIMDPQCILWRPYLASLDHPSIGMPALGFEICHDICWMFVCSFRQVLRVYTLA